MIGYTELSLDQIEQVVAKLSEKRNYLKVE